MSEPLKVTTSDGRWSFEETDGPRGPSWWLRGLVGHVSLAWTKTDGAAEAAALSSFAQDLASARGEIAALKKELSDDDTRIFDALSIKIRTEPLPPDAKVIELYCEEEFVREIEDPSPWKKTDETPGEGEEIVVLAKSRYHLVEYSERNGWMTHEGIFLGSEDVEKWMSIPRD